MIKELKVDSFIRLCECEREQEILYSSLNFAEDRSIINLPDCLCGNRKEFIKYGQGTNSYAQMVAKIFAEVAIRGI